MKKHVFLVCAIAFFGLSGLAWAGLDLSNTELIKVEGKVEVKKGAEPAYKTVPANLKLAGGLKRLDSGDKVKTAGLSGAEMILKETCVLAVKEKSMLEVPAVVGQAAISQLKAGKGSFLFKVVSGSNFQVQTADVIAGVKGTLFGVEMVDDLRGIIELPNLAIGLESAGGTTINVYEGEVELKHAQTGKLRRLKAGEGLGAFGRKLFGLDASLADGFSPLIKFKPLEKLTKQFGALGSALHGIPSSRLGIMGLSTEGLAMPLQLGKMSDRLNNLTESLTGGLRAKLAALDNVRGVIQDKMQTLKDLKGEAFKPKIDDGKYPRFNREMVVPEQRVEEAYVGNGLFVSFMPAQGCQSMKLLSDDDDEGMKLTEGEGVFHVRDLMGDIDGYVNVKNENGILTSQVQMNKGSLVARTPADAALIQVSPQAPLAVRSTATGQVERAQVANLPVPQEISQYKFRAEADIEAQRAEHNRIQNQKRGAAVQKVIGERGNSGSKIKLPKIKLW